MDALLTAADTAPTSERARELHQQAERAILRDMPPVPSPPTTRRRAGLS
ncbi:hypothetical protein [Saccharothrix sp. ALI-22-I]|nr:hypothetical protein [Saccharothrix sp. ALI-22-I]